MNKKLLFSIWGIFILLVIVVAFIEHKISFPTINLPEIAHHNTLGELPIVEAMDDGDFYEIDGQEDISPKECRLLVIEKCHGNANCYLEAIQYCDELREKQIKAAAISGDFTARWMIFNRETYGSLFCPEEQEICDAKFNAFWNEGE